MAACHLTSGSLGLDISGKEREERKRVLDIESPHSNQGKVSSHFVDQETETRGVSVTGSGSLSWKEALLRFRHKSGWSQSPGSVWGGQAGLLSTIPPGQRGSSSALYI